MRLLGRLRGNSIGILRRPFSAQSSNASAPARKSLSWLPDDDKTLRHFLPHYKPRPRRSGRAPLAALSVEAAERRQYAPSRAARRKLFHIETRGCQMNVADTAVIRSLLQDAGYMEAEKIGDAEIVLINTCAIRDNAERKVWQWLRERRAADTREMRPRRTYALLGCMAERLKEKILDNPARLVDAVVGPDAYRDLPSLLDAIVYGATGAAGYNVQLSVDETYGDITPVRSNTDNRHSAFVSIARSCSMSCSFCIVPHVRGPERSRSEASIIAEVKALVDQGVKEVVCLGQNVNNYHVNDASSPLSAPIPLSQAFKLPGVVVPNATRRFPDLLHAVASIDPEVRVRFTSPHPAHFPDDLLILMKETPNICNSIHLPLQSGSTAVLDRMRRRYGAEAYRDLVDKIRETIPGVTLSTDIICGFCGETEEDHEDTLKMLRHVVYDHAFCYAFSEREKTEAARVFEDDVPHETKLRRLREVLDLFHDLARKNNAGQVGSCHLVLVEDGTARSPGQWDPGAAAKSGRTDGNKRVVFRDIPVPIRSGRGLEPPRHAVAGEYVAVRVVSSTSLTLVCEPIEVTTISGYAEMSDL